MTLPQMYELVTRATAVKIIKITRVSQANGQDRFDVLVARAAVHQLVMDLQSANWRNGWYARLHRSYRERTLLRQTTLTPTRNNAPQPDYLTVLAWNINGLKEKREELLLAAREHQAAIILLQETGFKRNDWLLHLRGYRCVTRVATAQPGQRGLAVAVRSDLVSVPVGGDHPNFAWVKINHGGDVVLMATVYVPSSGPKRCRKDTLSQLAASYKVLRAKYPAALVVLGGDWNLPQEKVAQWILKHHLDLSAKPFRGSRITWSRPGRHFSALDAFLVSHNAGHRLAKAYVDRTWDASDHWPITTRLLFPQGAAAAGVVGAPQHRLKWSGQAMVQHSRAILGNNRFAALLDSIEQGPGNGTVEARLDQVAEAFLVACPKVLQEVGAHVQPPKRFHFGLKRTTKKLIAKRRHLAARRDLTDAEATGLAPTAPLLRALRLAQGATADLLRREQAAAGSSESESDDNASVTSSTEELTLAEEYKGAQAAARKAIKADEKTAWLRVVRRGASLFVSNQPKKLWAWIRSTMHRTHQGQVLAPIHNRAGVLCTGPDEIAQAWAEHYETLGADATGHSKDAGHWPAVLGSVEQGPMEGRELEGINGDITWADLHGALESLKGSKAPGPSGLTAEFFQLILEPSPLAAQPQTVLGKLVFRLVGLMWTFSHVPNSFKLAEIISIHKKGDATDPANYRGISLIEVLLKAVTNIMVQRVSKAVESAKLFSVEQGGFRTFEESTALAVALFDICYRRLLNKKPTYLAFLDIQKAFDCVPHEALLLRLQQFGVRGKCLKFFEALYRDLRVKIKLNVGTAPAFQLQRGVRQGCPSSPLAWDIFFDQLPAHIRALGVEVAGIERVLAILLFADDAVLLAASRRKLRQQLAAVAQFVGDRDLAFGVGKCGVMVVGSDRRQARLQAARLTLHGQEIPVVEEYLYLGLPFNRRLDLQAVARARADKVRAALFAARDFLRNSLIPVVLRRNVFQASVLSVAVFGGELLGGVQQRAEPVQRVMNVGLRWVAGLSSRSRMCSSVVLMAEFGLMPISARWAGARARAYVKWTGSKTWMGLLRNSRLSVRRKATWAVATRRWIKTFGLPKGTEFETLPPKKVAAMVRAHRLQAVQTQQKRHSRTLLRYLEFDFGKTRKYLLLGAQYPSLAKGFQALLQCRVNALLTAPRAVKAMLLPATWAKKCPSCLRRHKETVEHVVAGCRAWRAERAALWDRIRLDIGEEVWRPLSHVEHATLLLGGAVGELRWKQFLPRRSEHWGRNSEGTEGAEGAAAAGDAAAEAIAEAAEPADGLPGCVAVATFLQAIQGPRLRRLWSQSTVSRRPSGYGSLT